MKNGILEMCLQAESLKYLSVGQRPTDRIPYCICCAEQKTSFEKQLESRAKE